MADFFTVYTLTNRRIVMRFGVALPMMINVPLDKIESADLAEYGEFGDIALTLAPGERISYMALWPHARPWHHSKVKPMLRGLPNVSVAAALLANAVECGKLPGDIATARDGVDRLDPQPAPVVPTQPLAT